MAGVENTTTYEGDVYRHMRAAKKMQRKFKYRGIKLYKVSRISELQTIKVCFHNREV